MELDYSRQVIWSLSEMTGGPLPPYLLEIIMKDGRGFYVHSGSSRDEKSRSVVINIWDLRAINTADEEKIKQTLDQPKAWEELSSKQPWDLHPALSVGKLRCTLDEILYLVEWWTRYWSMKNFLPDEAVRKMGFLNQR